MLHIIFIKCKVDVMYFIFIFISPSIPRFSVKKSVNQLIKNKRPYPEIVEIETVKISIQNGPGLVGTNKMSPESRDQ